MDSGDLLHESSHDQNKLRDKNGANLDGCLDRFESIPDTPECNNDHPMICQGNDKEMSVRSMRPSSDLNLESSDHRESSIKVGKRDRSQSRGKTSSYGNESPPMLAPNVKLSSVLVHPRHHMQETTANEIKRKAILESQRNDKQAFDRNKRMFGMLMGTLQQFKTEEHGRERLTIKRSRIEEKLEMADKEERSNISITTNNFTRPNHERLLPGNRSPKEERPSPDKVDLKLDITNRFKRWESTHRHYYNFIQTEAKPRIFWLPKEHTSTTEKKLRETKDYISICIAERAAKLNKELGDLDVNFKDPLKKEQTPDSVSEIEK